MQGMIITHQLTHSTVHSIVNIAHYGSKYFKRETEKREGGRERERGEL